MTDCLLKAKVTRINKTGWEMDNTMWQVPQKRNKKCIVGKGRREGTLPERVGRGGLPRRESSCRLRVSKHLKDRKKEDQHARQKNNISKSTESRKGMMKSSAL